MGSAGGVGVGWNHILHTHRTAPGVHGQCVPQSTQQTGSWRGVIVWLVTPTWSPALGVWVQSWRQWLPRNPLVRVRGGGRSTSRGGCLSPLLCTSWGYRVCGTGRCVRRVAQQRHQRLGGIPNDCRQCRCSRARGRYSVLHMLRCLLLTLFQQLRAMRFWISRTLSAVAWWMWGGGS